MTYDLYAARELFEDEHGAFRSSVREFLSREVVDHIEQWDEEGIVPRRVWHTAGSQGLLGLAVPEEYGGGGVLDYRFRLAMIEEFARAGATSVSAGFSTHTDIVVPYFVNLASVDQAKRWLPGLAAGES